MATSMMRQTRQIGSRFGVAVLLASAALAVLGASASGVTRVHLATNPITAGHSYRHGAVPMRGWLRSHPQFAVKYDSSINNLQYGGGIDGVGVTTGAEKVYLVFWGSQWGTESTNGAGYQAFTGDTDGMAPDLQAFFKGLGTGGETWSGVMTQYCEGVASGAQDCAPSDAHVAYPTGGALAGVWADTSAAAPASATGNQIGVEALAGAHHFGNTTQASNRDTQYVVVSPHGTDPDSYEQNGFCAWHDYSGDSSLDGGGAVPSDVGEFAFTNLPYLPDAGASCGADFVNAGGTLDGVSIVGGHEYAETITDQFPAGGWLDTSGNETGDKCAWIQSGQGASQDVTLATGTFAVQSTWANDFNGGAGGCEASHPIVGLSTPMVATTVDDAATSAAWSGTETTGATAFETASVTSLSVPAPTGTVSFTLYTGSLACTGASTSGSAISLSGGTADSATTAKLGAGSYSYRAAYSGDSNYASATSSCDSFVVRKTPNVIKITSTAPSKPAVGGSYRPTATATSHTAVAITLDAASKGCTLTVGLVKFTATGTCVLDFNNAGSSSYLAAARVQQKLPVVKGAVSMAASAKPSSTTSSTKVVLSVTLSSLLATGTVTFTTGTRTLCSVKLTSGKGTCKVTKTLAKGTYKVTAKYPGSTLFLATTATTTFKVT
jgi:serine protease